MKNKLPLAAGALMLVLQQVSAMAAGTGDSLAGAGAAKAAVASPPPVQASGAATAGEATAAEKGFPGASGLMDGVSAAVEIANETFGAFKSSEPPAEPTEASGTPDPSN